MRIKWALKDMAGSHLNVSDNVRKATPHLQHPTNSLTSMQGAPETRVPHQDLRGGKACNNRGRQASFKKSWLQASQSTGERLLATVLIARKQPELAMANQRPGAPVVKPARPIRRRQAGLLATPGRGEGSALSQGLPLAPRVWEACVGAKAAARERQ